MGKGDEMTVLLRLLAIACAFLINSVLAADQQIDFKGTALGASEQDFAAKHARYRCSDTEPKFRSLSDRTCFILGKPDKSFQDPKDRDGTFAGVPANIFANFYDNRLHRISVSLFASEFGRVLKALNERYGTPDSFETPVVKNRMGAEFQNAVAVWKRDGVSLKAEKYGSDLSTSSVSYTTDWGSEESKKRRGQDSKKAAGDI